MITLSGLSWFIILSLFCHGNAQSKSYCECVPFYLCENGTINSNGQGIIDIRITPDNCSNYMEICCNISKVISVAETRASSAPIELKCGERKPFGVGYRIIGDEDNEAQFGEFPWMVAIFHKGPNDPKFSYKCGGSLIHPEVVLTAAHNILDGGSLRVRAGEWDSQTVIEMYKHQERRVISGVVNRGYKKDNLANDIALLFLESPIDTALHINTICLPPKDSVTLSDECFVTGWGKDTFGKDGIYQNILKRVGLSIVGYEQCQNNFRKTRLGKSFELDRSFICAGGEEGQDACTGDGGGPLVCPIPGTENRYQQVGIVSWGIGCGNKGVPGAYTNVAQLRNWIDEQMTKRKLNASTYLP